MSITQNFADDLNKFLEFAKESFDTGLTLSDIVNHHLHEIDRSLQYNKTEAKIVDLDLTLTASACDNLEYIAQNNEVSCDFIFEKVVETIISDRKFRKWEKDLPKESHDEDTAAVH